LPDISFVLERAAAVTKYYVDGWERRFYSSKTWQKKRAYILLRDKYMCQCHKIFGGKPCKRIANEVHHIKELADNPELALVDSNLLSMSRKCHEKTKGFKKNIKAPEGVRVIKI
jgi:5-methylcytosine-specific restriction endonuclease McrA